jgi:mycothiol synthase
MSVLPLEPAPDLPTGWRARVPYADDLAALVALRRTHRKVYRGEDTSDLEAVAADAVGPGSWTRRQVLVEDPDGRVVAWATVHDRAAGRTDVRLTLDPALTAGDPATADAVAHGLLAWQREVGLQLATARGLGGTQLDADADATDQALQRWLAAEGYARARRWLHMSRPVSDDEALTAPREGVLVRRVGIHQLADGTTMPVAEDLQEVHRMLEESFEDHFNSYRESFAEFVQRLREDPGHRWDHWWLALVDTDEGTVTGGALVSTVLPPDAHGIEGSYVDYIGVHRRARGRGVAKALLGTVIADAVARGRNRVDLEVDADSPTGADGLYRSLGWETSYLTESWHLDV